MTIRLLNLILYNDETKYNIMRDILRKYLITTNIRYYFYCYKKDIDSDFLIEGDMLYIRGSESFLPGILKKTLKAFEIVQQLEFDYDYILRSNASTIVNLDLLCDYLEKNSFDYGGGNLFTLDWLHPVSGVYDHRYRYTKFIEGTAIILSKKCTQLLIEKQHEIRFSVQDDLAMGLFFENQKIHPHDMWNYFYKNSYEFNSSAIFYRNHRIDRNKDFVHMKFLITNLIKNKNINSDSDPDPDPDSDPVSDTVNKRNIIALYGSNSIYTDVTEIVNQSFLKKDKIYIPAEACFNNIFGDPIPDVVKYLFISIDGKTNIIDENRTNDFEI